MNESKPINAHIWTRDPYDFYTEPFWCDVALFKAVTFRGSVYDPACGLGRIVQAARDAGLGGVGTDIAPRSSYVMRTRDFLRDSYVNNEVDSIVSNPPFKHAVEFVERALEVAKYEVAFLLPARFLWGAERSRWLAKTPLRQVLAIAPRPSMPPGELVESGAKVGGGKEDFIWAIWQRGYCGRPEFGWLRKDAS